MTKTRSLTTAALALVVGVGAATVTSLQAPAAQAQELWTQRRGAAFDQSRPLSFGHFRDLAKRLSPAVVNVQVTKTLRPAGSEPDSPFDLFFSPRRQHMLEREQQGAGTGFIIHKDGLILTNNHVVEGADEVSVTLLDEREFRAKVVGADPATDVALIKIDAEGLTPAPLGDSKALEVGEWVMAIGNPFGLSHTVTTGIVSAKGRKQVRPDDRLRYKDFIQTDASINPGNSGGPLINVSGEVVGINSAIFGRQNVGVGFAIPIHIAKELIPALEKHGAPRRSWIGVGIQEVTPQIAAAFGLDKPRGALINRVWEDGPGDEAGVRRGDVIVRFNDRPIENVDDLPWLASTAGIGAEVPAVVLREGERRTVTIKLRQMPGSLTNPNEGERAPKRSERSHGALGLTVAPLTSSTAQSYRLDGDTTGVVVTDVDHGSPAHKGGLRRGDLVLELDETPVADVRGFAEQVKAMRKGRSMRLLVRRRGGQSLFVALKKP